MIYLIILSLLGLILAITDRFEVPNEMVGIILLLFLSASLTQISAPDLFQILFFTFSTIILLHSLFQGFRPNYFSLIIFSLVGLLGLTTTTDLFTFYVFWELSILPSYVLAAFTQSENASIKYAFMNIVGSVMILTGITLYYGLNHTLTITTLTSPYSFLPFILLIPGFGIKTGILPFSSWMPELYEKTKAGLQVFFSSVMSAGGILSILILLTQVFNSNLAGLTTAVIALISMTIANISGLRENNLKKLLAFASIAHLSYILLGISSLSAIGMTGGLLNLINHSLVFSILFFSLDVYSKRGKKPTLSGIKGGFWQSPVLGLVFILGLLTAVGLPGTSMFLGEYKIITSWMKQPIIPLIMGLNILLSAIYYFRFIHTLLMQNSEEEFEINLGEAIIILTLATLLITLSINPNPALSLIRRFLGN